MKKIKVKNKNQIFHCGTPLSFKTIKVLMECNPYYMTLFNIIAKLSLAQQQVDSALLG